MASLSEEELTEIRKRPVSGNPQEFTLAQWAVRVQIGHKLNELSTADALVSPETASLAPLYDQYPPWKFYTDEAGEAIWRIRGFAQHADGTHCAHTVRAMIMFNNCAVGGVPLTEIRPLDAWSPRQLEFLQSGMIVGAGGFLDPLGYILFAN